MVDWVKKYEEIKPRYEHLTRTMSELLTHLLQEEQIDYFSPLQARTKPLLSFQEKISRKKYRNPLREITDLTGLRVVVFYPDEILHVRRVIAENFKIDPRRSVDKIAQLAKHEFSYEGVHYVVSLSDEQLEQPEYREFAKMKFEIQLLTLCQFAWAETQRKIEYKSEELVPPALSRRLARLLALFELADDEFMDIRDEEIQTLLQYRLSRVSLKHFLHTSPTLRTLMKQATQARFVRMNPLEDSRYLTELLQACSSLGFKRIAPLDTLLSSEENVTSFMLSREKRQDVAIRVGPTTFSLVLIYHSDPKFSRRFLSKKGWKDPVLSMIVDRRLQE